MTAFGDAPASNISANTSNSNVSNSDIYQPICTEPKSSEDKEMDDFLDSTYKEQCKKWAGVDPRIIYSRAVSTRIEYNNNSKPCDWNFRDRRSQKANTDEASQHLAQLCDKAFDAEDGANRAS